MRWLIAGGVLVLIAVVAMQYEGSRVPENVSRAKVTPKLSVAANDLSLRFKPLSDHRYRYSFERQLAFHGFPGKNPKIAYQGELWIDVVSSDANQFEALVRVKFSPEKNPSRAVLKIHVDAKGQLLSLRGLSDDMREMQDQESILKDLIAQWLFPIMIDTVGTYTADFKRLAADRSLQKFEKNKVRYLEPGLPQIAYSRHRLFYDPAFGLPQKISGEEGTRLSSNTEVSAESSYVLQFISASKAVDTSEGLRARLSSSRQLTLSTKAGPEPMDAQEAAQRKAAVLVALQQLDSFTASQRLNVFGELVRLYRSGIFATSELQALIDSPALLQQGARSVLFKTVIGTLMSVGTPQAQKAVLEVYKNPNLPVSGKGSILAALTTAPVPLENATRTFLADTMKSESHRDLSQGAAFALGSSLNSGAQSAQGLNTVEANGFIQMIRDRWNVAGNLNEKMAILDAMGNSGRTEFLDVLTSVVQESEKPVLRAKAVFALRFVQSEVAVNLLSKSVRDAEVKVRQAAVDALQLAPWNEAFRQPLELCRSLETVATLQSACSTYLNNQ